MKNNLLALVFHFIIIFITGILALVLFVVGPIINSYILRIGFMLFLSLTILFLYFFAGTFLDIKKNKIYDFFSGSFIGLIGIILWIYTISITGMKFPELPTEFMVNAKFMLIYLSPFTLIFSIASNFSPISFLIANLLPSILMGLGIKYKRFKINKIVKN
jgi:hypothetical protein